MFAGQMFIRFMLQTWKFSTQCLSWVIIPWRNKYSFTFLSKLNRMIYKLMEKVCVSPFNFYFSHSSFSFFQMEVWLFISSTQKPNIQIKWILIFFILLFNSLGKHWTLNVIFIRSSYLENKKNKRKQKK